MTLTIGWWAIPTVVTVAIWFWAATRPFGSGLDITPIFNLGAAIIVTLFAWLVYFASWALFA